MNIDEKYIKRCFALARKGRGKVSPNPAVGAVIVKDGKVIGEGYHEYFGGAHAEVNAIRGAGNVKGATLYCNLEPCCHTNKKTPPCAPLVISSGIKRLVVSNVDPNPEVAGKGLEQIRQAGVEVVQGVLEEEGKELNKFFFKYAASKIPYVTVKIAQSLDGKITKLAKTQTWITGEKSAEFVHRLRAEYDAVLVGAGTVNIDNPRLTVRKVKGRNPYRVVLDGPLISRVESDLFNDEFREKTIIVTSVSARAEKKEALIKKGIKLLELEGGEVLPVPEVLKKLGEEGISSLLVEGGSEIFGKFLCGKLYDEIIILQAPEIFGEGVSAVNCAVAGLPPVNSVEKLGEDIKIVMRA